VNGRRTKPAWAVLLFLRRRGVVSNVGWADDFFSSAKGTRRESVAVAVAVAVAVEL